MAMDHDNYDVATDVIRIVRNLYYDYEKHPSPHDFHEALDDLSDLRQFYDNRGAENLDLYGKGCEHHDGVDMSVDYLEAADYVTRVSNRVSALLRDHNNDHPYVKKNLASLWRKVDAVEVKMSESAPYDGHVDVTKHVPKRL